MPRRYKQGADCLLYTSVRAMEKKGIRTEKGEFNRWIKATNALIREVRNCLLYTSRCV